VQVAIAIAGYIATALIAAWDTFVDW